MTWMRPVQSWCGWAFSSDGRPWVAQRVWPMPTVPDGIPSASTWRTRSTTLFVFLTVATSPSASMMAHIGPLWNGRWGIGLRGARARGRRWGRDGCRRRQRPHVECDRHLLLRNRHTRWRREVDDLRVEPGHAVQEDGQ